ncbi:MAG: type IV secretory system conjugative DNA transfer family protein [Lachnospiraceae bacterium]|nr:type IV secretory system conjugative DNA transfer family protein [Lachnospiraceae bacterium]
MNSFDKVILGKHTQITTDSKVTGRNNNVLVIGTSGSGKTYSLVEPTLMETNHSSLVVSDPKGSLSPKYADYFKRKGYRVEILNFIHPEKSTLSYDPLRNGEIQNSQQAIALAHTLIHSSVDDVDVVQKDPYWDQAAEMLIASIILLLLEVKASGTPSFSRLMGLMDSLSVSEANEEALKYTPLGKIMQSLRARNPKSEAVTMYHRVISTPSKTLNCIISTAQAAIARYNTTEMKTFMDLPNLFDPACLVNEKTVLFVQCSDVDDTLYGYINMLYTQTMQHLFQLSDEAEDRNRLRSVRFILDDFATNVVIPQMPKWSGMMRERRISVMLMLQSITQLEEMYDARKARTIISNCDQIVFLRTNDLETAREFSYRLDLPVTDVLYSPIGTEYIFLSGTKPIKDERFDMKTQSKEYRKVYRSKSNVVKVRNTEENREQRLA